ncbi:MAG TPA: response regulator transcription factor [Anaerolineales bacterium]|nr:response regulator transcription factor [Anaerolineales bacterium]
MSQIPKILIISDLQTTSPLWAFSITQARWDIALEPDPAKAVERWAELLPDLIVCDIDSDSVSLEIVTKLREQAVLPILLLSSKREKGFILEAYEAGVNECILKPIEPTLFEVKLKAWLRHTSNVPVDVLEAIKVDDFHLIPADRVVVLDKKDPIHLTNLEFRLLYYLMGRSGRVLTTEELCHYVWSHHSAGDPVMLKSLVYRLRRKIEADPANPHYVHTVAGVGYRFFVK